MKGQPVPVFECGGEPYRALDELPIADPTATNFQTARNEAHGCIPESSWVTIEVDGACDITMFVFSRASNTWVLAGGTSARHKIACVAAAEDDFRGPAGQMVYFKSSTGDINGFTSARPVNEVYGPS